MSSIQTKEKRMKKTIVTLMMILSAGFVSADHRCEVMATLPDGRFGINENTVSQAEDASANVYFVEEGDIEVVALSALDLLDSKVAEKYIGKKMVMIGYGEMEDGEPSINVHYKKSFQNKLFSSDEELISDGFGAASIQSSLQFVQQKDGIFVSCKLLK